MHIEFNLVIFIADLSVFPVRYNLLVRSHNTKTMINVHFDKFSVFRDLAHENIRTRV